MQSLSLLVHLTVTVPWPAILVGSVKSSETSPFTVTVVHQSYSLLVTVAVLVFVFLMSSQSRSSRALSSRLSTWLSCQPMFARTVTSTD